MHGWLRDLCGDRGKEGEFVRNGGSLGNQQGSGVPSGLKPPRALPPSQAEGADTGSVKVVAVGCADHPFLHPVHPRDPTPDRMVSLAVTRLNAIPETNCHSWPTGEDGGQGCRGQAHPRSKHLGF